MTKPGPKPKPTTLRVLEGDPNKHRYNFNEPQGSDFSADPTERVRSKPEALELWHFLVPRLDRMGVLKDEDRVGLEALCVIYAAWCEQPSIPKTRMLQALLSEFGLTPSSRTRLVGNLPHEAKSKMARIIGG